MTVGVAIQAASASAFVEQVQLAERLGISTAWTTIGGAGGADPLTTYAVALTKTERIKVGTAIVQTWPKHPIAIASGSDFMAFRSILYGHSSLEFLIVSDCYVSKYQDPAQLQTTSD